MVGEVGRSIRISQDRAKVSLALDFAVLGACLPLLNLDKKFFHGC